MSNIAFLFLPLVFSSLPAVLPFVSPSSQVESPFVPNPSAQGEVEIRDPRSVSRSPTWPAWLRPVLALLGG